MARIEWTRLEPGDVESVLSVMLLRRHPSGRRPMPSQGDGGIDVYLAGECWTVFQIKSFTGRLTASQKRQITKSWKRVNEVATAEGWTIAEWNLLRPANPTREEEKWFEELTAGASVPCSLLGLDFCDGLAAEFPDVVDYYLYDGRQRVQDTVANFLHVAGLAGSGDPTAPSEAITSMESLHERLNSLDPHYRYDYSVDTVPVDSPWPPVQGGPGFVAAAIARHGTRVITVKIYGRFHEATVERPVPGGFTVEIEEGSPDAAEWQDFLDYGSGVDGLPVQQVFADLPGGLGTTEPTAGTITIGPSRVPIQGQPDLTLEVVDPAGALLGAADIRLRNASHSLDGQGLALDGREYHGTFDFTMRMRERRATITVSTTNLTGAVPADVVAGLSVLSHLAPPNALRLSIRNGPPLADPVGIDAQLVDTESVHRIVDLCADLATIQRKTVMPIRVPDLTGLTFGDALPWKEAARLLRGEVLTGTWSEPIHIVPNPDPPLPDGDVTLRVAKPLTVEIGGQTVDLGHKVHQIATARVDPAPLDAAEGEDHIVRLIPGDDSTVITFYGRTRPAVADLTGPADGWRSRHPSCYFSISFSFSSRSTSCYSSHLSRRTPKRVRR